MKYIVSVAAIAFGMFCCQSIDRKEPATVQKDITVYPKDSLTWYFIIFSVHSGATMNSTTMSRDSNFVLLNASDSYGKIVVLNKLGRDISKDMVLSSWQEVEEYKIFQFYYPGMRTKRELQDKAASFRIEKEGMDQLDKILQDWVK